jgi:hypothetical protein
MGSAVCEPISELCRYAALFKAANFGLSVPRAEAVSLGTSRHETASFAPIGSLRSEEASRDSLAKIISTNVSVQFLRRLGNRRVGVGRGARVHRSARVRVESGLAGRAGTSLGYPSAISLFLPINMAHWQPSAGSARDNPTVRYGRILI